MVRAANAAATGHQTKSGAPEINVVAGKEAIAIEASGVPDDGVEVASTPEREVVWTAVDGLPVCPVCEGTDVVNIGGLFPENGGEVVDMEASTSRMTSVPVDPFNPIL
jgi:hypothetical protein